MEGGIAVFLLLVIAVVVIGGGVALYLTGGALWASGSRREKDERRPTHKAPTTPAQEHTHFVGTPSGDEAARRES